MSSFIITWPAPAATSLGPASSPGGREGTDADGCISLSFCSGMSQLDQKGTLERSSPFPGRPAVLTASGSSLGHGGQSPQNEPIASRPLR